MAIATAQNQIASNLFKTWLIMFFFMVFIVAVVYLFALGSGFQTPDALGLTGMALVLAGIMNIVSYFYSDKMVLAISGAKPVQLKDNEPCGSLTAKELYHLVENLCIADGLPVPKIYTINDTALNAFATGRDPNHAVICFTTGILDSLSKEELEGVTAHELSHVKNRDILLSSVVAILVGFIALLADWFLRMSWFRNSDRDEDRNGSPIFFVIAIVAAILAPLVATLIQLAISRRRESLADASGVLLTRNPEGLISALRKLSGDKEPLEAANRATAHLYIVNPLKGSEAVSWLAGLFNTHPPIAERIKALGAMEGQNRV